MSTVNDIALALVSTMTLALQIQVPSAPSKSPFCGGDCFTRVNKYQDKEAHSWYGNRTRVSTGGEVTDLRKAKGKGLVP